ncbi:lectin-like domain-containing protein [Streptomyces fractus]|uniref:lectin-like domain-containing protein n=1 Tax=Streptomyces fractus TaxID=641806 RepID=UPI003CECF213
MVPALPARLRARVAMGVCVLAAGATALASPLLTPAPAGAANRPAPAAGEAVNTLVAEDFGRDSLGAGPWTAVPGVHDGADGYSCLTAARGRPGPLAACPSGTRDAEGQGVLRLTDKKKYQAGYLIYDEAVPSDAGITATFDSYQYDTATALGADGISFFLLDGAAKVGKRGVFGGALGYKDLPGGYLGLGLDQYGNFSNPKYGGVGGPGNRPNTVALRGATDIGSPYISGSKRVRQLATQKVKKRDAARRSARVELTPDGVLTVTMDFHDGTGYQRLVGPVDLHRIPGQPDVPKTLKFGFAAATGAHTAVHEVSDIRFQKLPPDLYVTPKVTGKFVAGGTGKLELTVANRPGAGRSEQPVTLKTKLPPGLTPKSAKGDGWDCQVEDRELTCTRPGSQDDALPPGDAFPPVVVPVDAGEDAGPSAPAEVRVDTPGEELRANNVEKPELVVGRKSGLWLKESANPDPYVAGKPLTYTVAVGNHGPSKATDAPLTAKVPDVLEDPKWTCEASGGAECPATPEGPGLDTPVTLPADAKLVFKATGDVPSDETGPLPGNARLMPAPGVPDDKCGNGCTDRAEVSGSRRTALSVEHRHTPKVLQSGEDVTYEIVVRNEGPSDAKGVRIQQAAPELVKGTPWTCKARKPSVCGDLKGKVPVSTTADIVAGGEVVYTMSGPLKRDELVSEVTVDPPLDGVDANCQKSCSVKDTADLP